MRRLGQDSGVCLADDCAHHGSAAPTVSAGIHECRSKHDTIKINLQQEKRGSYLRGDRADSRTRASNPHGMQSLCQGLPDHVSSVRRADCDCHCGSLRLRFMRMMFLLTPLLCLRSTAAVFGGMNKHEQWKALKAGCEIVVATPGRLLDMLTDQATNMRRCTFLVLDEADRMFSLGFGNPYCKSSSVTACASRVANSLHRWPDPT